MHQPTFFEGPEKKLELVLTPGQPSLRARGRDFWEKVVEASRAQVLNVLSNDQVDAYLLSESSLFVWDSSLTMITCGQTRLVDAALMLVEALGEEAIAFLVYERKNEHFPERQYTSFFEDAGRLNAVIPGTALRFGADHDHHINVFHSGREHVAERGDTTVEILMHSLSEESARRWFGQVPPAAGTLAERHGITSVLPGFEIDEFPFTPAGYSMNALRGAHYYTIHVTPEMLGSYVSFEANVDIGTGEYPSLTELVARVVEVFEPGSFDVMVFAGSDSTRDALTQTLTLPGHITKETVSTRFGGYDVRFWHCYRPSAEVGRPSLLPL